MLSTAEEEIRTINIVCTFDELETVCLLFTVYKTDIVHQVICPTNLDTVAKQQNLADVWPCSFHLEDDKAKNAVMSNTVMVIFFSPAFVPHRCRVCLYPALFAHNASWDGHWIDTAILFLHFSLPCSFLLPQILPANPLLFSIMICCAHSLRSIRFDKIKLKGRMVMFHL